MPVIHYDPERILNGFTIDGLKELAKRLRRRTRTEKRDIIQDILSPPGGKGVDIGKVWREINRSLRKESEAFSPKELEDYLSNKRFGEDRFKVGYMLTLSSNPEVRTIGETIYSEVQNLEESQNTNSAHENDDHRDLKKSKEDKEDEAIAVMGMLQPKEKCTEEILSQQSSDNEQIMPKETIEQLEAGNRLESAVRDVRKSFGVLEVDAKQAKVIEGKAKAISKLSKDRVCAGVSGEPESSDVRKRIKTLEKKRKKVISDGQGTKEQIESMRKELNTLNNQLLKEKDDNEKYRQRIRKLETECLGKDKELDLLKKKIEQLQKNNLFTTKTEHTNKLDLAACQGRKALIFAEHDNNVDSQLSALGIIPIWAMEIDWNRPRRRMSTCQIVLYKKDREKLKKLEEIQEISRHLNVPCSELLEVVGGCNDQR